MSHVAIPAWTADGVLPPIHASQPVSPERSPYVVSLTDYVLRFGDTPERRTILDGFCATARRCTMSVCFKAFNGSMGASSSTLK
jgi:hypothetical protein